MTRILKCKRLYYLNREAWRIEWGRETGCLLGLGLLWVFIFSCRTIVLMHDSAVKTVVMVEPSQCVIHVRSRAFVIHAQPMFTWKQHPYHHCRAMSTPAWLAVTNRQNNMLYVIISKDLDPSYWYLEKYRLLPKGVRQLASTWSSKPLALIVFFLNTGLASNEGSVSVALEAALEGFYNTTPREAHPVRILTVLK